MIGNFLADEIIRNSLKEDINYIDLATDYLIPSDHSSIGSFIAKDDGIICGINIALRTFIILSEDKCSFEIYKKDGDRVKKGELIAKIEAKTQVLLKGERTALNILSHLSGIATATDRLSSLCEGTGAVVVDTRKTLPGLRALQKYAVVTGGGRNHRFNLSDAAMIKDNHIDAAGGIAAAVSRLRQRLGHTVKIEVETRNLDEVIEAVECRADIIMLDNMDIEEITKAVEIIGNRAIVEVSGNVSESNIRQIASTGVNVISVGRLTHSVKALDISMKIK